MIELLRRALEIADTEYVDIRFEEITRTEIIYMGKELDEIGVKVRRGGSVRAFHRGAFGFATFTLPEEATNAVKHAVRLAKLASKQGDGRLFPMKPITAKVPLNIKNDPRNVTLDEKEALTRKYNEILLSGGEKIQSTRTIYRDEYIRHYFLSSEGSSIEEERLHTGISMSATARDGTNVQTAWVTFGDQRGYDTVTGHEPDAEQVVKDALDLLKAEKVDAGVYTVILDPRLAGVFIHEAFGHLSEADHICRNDKLRNIMKIGAQFGIDQLSVVDDGSLIGERGYYAYDDDGVPSRKTYLIKDGKLHSHLHSRYTAYLMDEEPTGNSRALNYTFMPIVRMSVTYIEPRDASFDELIDIPHGLYVVGALGGQTELEMFTFSSMKAYVIEKGKLKKMVRDVILSGNVFETLKNIDKIGNDLQIYGGLGGCGKAGQSPLPVSDGAPHIRIKNVVIGGK